LSERPKFFFTTARPVLPVAPITATVIAALPTVGSRALPVGFLRPKRAPWRFVLARYFGLACDPWALFRTRSNSASAGNDLYTDNGSSAAAARVRQAADAKRVTVLPLTLRTPLPIRIWSGNGLRTPLIAVAPSDA
jgi:hypothetical protein